MIAIVVDKTELENLQKEYPASKDDIMKEVNKTCEYYNKNPFPERKREYFIDKIKRSITLINMDVPENKEEIPQILKKPDLLEIINKEFNKFIVGEKETRKAIFICSCGSWVENLNAHFNILVNGESSAGKSWITKNVLKIFPDKIFSEETYRTRISSRALTYWHNSKVEPEWTWDGKILYLEDCGNDIINSDVFKVMTSEGSRATIVGKYRGKKSELPTTFDIVIQGKPITFVTTAGGSPFEEIKNRFFLIDLDESEEQTDKIMEKQAEWAINGEREKYDSEIISSLGKLQRVEVILPDWVKRIKDFIPRKDVLRWRREFPRFLEIIKCSAALHQYQRNEKEGKIVASEKDYEVARDVISKISTSSGIEGLTHREKTALEFIKQYYKKNDAGCTRSEIYAYKPVYSERHWERLLGKLAGKGLLNVRLEINPDSNRKSAHYYPTELENLSLPEFVILTGRNGPNGMDITHDTLDKSSWNGHKGRNTENAVNGGYKGGVVYNSKYFRSIMSTSAIIVKNGKVKELKLEAGKEYKFEDFGDNAEKVIKVLLDNKKIEISN